MFPGSNQVIMLVDVVISLIPANSTHLGTDLIAALACLEMYDFPHCSWSCLSRSAAATSPCGEKVRVIGLEKRDSLILWIPAGLRSMCVSLRGPIHYRLSSPAYSWREEVPPFVNWREALSRLSHLVFVRGARIPSLSAG